MTDRTAELRTEASPHGHLVQLHDADASTLIANVARYAGDGLRRGDGVLTIARPHHTTALVAAMTADGLDVEAAAAEGRFVSLDAARLLEQFLLDGQPDWARFTAVIEPLVRHIRTRSRGGLRAYGEMVGILWQAGHYAAAVRLEGFWNRLLAAGAFELYCAYPIDVLGAEFRPGDVGDVLCTHTHLVPAHGEHLHDALERAMHEVLGTGTAEVHGMVSAVRDPSWAALPDAEALILWLRSDLPEYADEILARTRRYYTAAAA